MKLDTSIFRYLSKDDFRVLTAVEMGLKNHEFVPAGLICQIAGLKGNQAQKSITVLHKHKLIAHEGKKYDGYKLTYNGYDFLALRVFMQRGLITPGGVGQRMGVGKEADIHVCYGPTEEGLRMIAESQGGRARWHWAEHGRCA